MNATLVRRSFIAFHLVLGLGLLSGSIQTLLYALAPENIHSHSHQHLALIAAARRLPLELAEAQVQVGEVGELHCNRIVV